MSKLLDLEQLKKLAKSLDNRAKEAIDIEKERAQATEAYLQLSVDDLYANIGTLQTITGDKANKMYYKTSDEDSGRVTIQDVDMDLLASEDTGGGIFMSSIKAHKSFNLIDGENYILNIVSETEVIREIIPAAMNSNAGGIMLLYQNYGVNGQKAVVIIDKIDIDFNTGELIVDDNTSIIQTIGVENIQSITVAKAVEFEVDSEFLETYKFVTEDEKALWNSMNAVTLNGFSIWVGTTEELNAIETRDPNTLYFEIGDAENTEQIVQNNPENGVLRLTKNKYQKAIIGTNTTIEFPSVNGYTELHLYLDADQDMNFVFPGNKTIEFKSSEKADTEDNINLTFPNCKWRMEPNVDYGRPYEIIATYNSIDWLIDVVVYS